MGEENSWYKSIQEERYKKSVVRGAHGPSEETSREA
jgi:hypothetical protein